MKEAWQHLKSSFASRLAGDERTQSQARGRRAELGSLSELRSSYRRLNLLTLRSLMKGSADSLETPSGAHYLSMSGFKILKKKKKRQRRNRSESFIFGRESSVQLWKHVKSFCLCLFLKHHCKKLIQKKKDFLCLIIWGIDPSLKYLVLFTQVSEEIPIS